MHSYEIPLRDRRGEVIACSLVDPDVYVWASEARWHLHRSDTKRYAARLSLLHGRQVRVFLHRVIMGLAPDDRRTVDHIDGNGLDNRRSNLRIATTAQNAQNQGSRGGTSQYRGVAWDKSRQKWQASITVDGYRRTLGRFDDEHEAGAVAAEARASLMPYSEEARAA